MQNTNLQQLEALGEKHWEPRRIGPTGIVIVIIKARMVFFLNYGRVFLIAPLRLQAWIVLERLLAISGKNPKLNTHIDGINFGSKCL